MMYTQPAITVSRMSAPSITVPEAREAVRRINARMSEGHEQVKGILRRVLNECLPDISRLYINDNYKILGYSSWLSCVHAELYYLSKYQKSYANLIGHASVIHAGLLEIVNEQPLLDAIRNLPLSASLGLEKLESAVLQAAALDEAARMASKIGPGQPVTAQMIKSAVNVIASAVTTHGMVDLGDKQVPATTGAVLVDYNEQVKAALDESRERLGRGEYETVYLTSRVVKLPKTERNYVIIELDNADYAAVAAQGVGGQLKVSLRRKKQTSDK